MFIKVIESEGTEDVFECSRYFKSPLYDKKEVQSGWAISIFKSLNPDKSSDRVFNFEWGEDCLYTDVFAMNSEGKTVERLFLNHIEGKKT